jgi:MtN3 and saliva related transmembrane protein
MKFSAETVGILAGALTTGSFLPQVFQIIRERNTSSISLGMYAAFTSGILMWLVYGVMIGSVSIMVTNVLTLILSGIVLVMKLRLG